MDPIRLFVPFLGSSTNVLARQNRHARNREVKRAHDAAFFAVKAAGLTTITTPVDLTFRARLGKGVRRRDTSNYSASVKHVEDGLVGAALLPDDRNTYVRRVIIEPPLIDRQADTGMFVTITPAKEEPDG